MKDIDTFASSLNVLINTYWTQLIIPQPQYIKAGSSPQIREPFLNYCQICDMYLEINIMHIDGFRKFIFKGKNNESKRFKSAPVHSC